MTEQLATVVDLIRHGETEGGQRYRGRLDDPLSEKGWAQMREAVGDCCPWQAVLSSPLRRCRAFAEELRVRHSLPIELDERLQEISFGDWEGRTAEEIEQYQPGALMRYYADPIAHAPSGSESLEDFRCRIAAFWHSLYRHYAGKKILVVAHAGVIRMILALVLDIPMGSLFRIKVNNAGITRIQCYAGDPPVCQLIFHGGSL